MTGLIYSFIRYPWFVSSSFPSKVMNKKMFPDTRFGRHRKKSKSLDYEKSVRVGEKWLWFSNSVSKMGPEFVVRPLYFFDPYFCRTVLWVWIFHCTNFFQDLYLRIYGLSNALRWVFRPSLRIIFFQFVGIGCVHNLEKRYKIMKLVFEVCQWGKYSFQENWIFVINFSF